MIVPAVFTLVDPRNGNLAFKLFTFNDSSYFDHLQRDNYYSLIWIISGTGKVKADFSEYIFEPNTIPIFRRNYTTKPWGLTGD